MVELSIAQALAAAVAALLSGGLIGVVLLHRRDLPRAMAEARKTEAEAGRITAEADDIKTASLERQLGRLDKRVEMLEHEVEDCHRDRDLALAAARFIWDRLQTVSPGDEVVEALREYLAKPPAFSTPRSMRDQLDKLK